MLLRDQFMYFILINYLACTQIENHPVHLKKQSGAGLSALALPANQKACVLRGLFCWRKKSPRYYGFIWFTGKGCRLNPSGAFRLIGLQK
jgi:hypothetical protein